MRSFIFLLMVFLTINTNAQSKKASELLKSSETQTVERFDTSMLLSDKFVIAVPYSSKLILNLPTAMAMEGKQIVAIELVYTDFPKNNVKRQNFLNKMRIMEIWDKLPQSKEVPAANWTFIKQSECKNKAEAMEMFHGFVLTLTEAYIPPDFTDEAKLEELLEGDSTISTIVDRNADWKKMLVVTDLTGSMAPYTAQLLVWFKLNEAGKKMEHLVFFNDGDKLEDEEKVVGKTGGIYDGPFSSFDNIAELANKTANGGHGGDIPENNIEAILHGTEACPDCEDIIMIADNWASPRDMELLNKVQKPIKIILCGTDWGINPIYLNIAYKTKGSVHTIEEDILNLVEMSEGEKLKIGEEEFIIRNGQFELVKRI